MSAQTYENFVKNHKTGTFFQSFVFGEFQEKIPYRGKSWTLASCLVVKMRLPTEFSWLWIPYGPLIAENHGLAAARPVKEIFADLARIAKEENAVFARIEPPFAITEPKGSKRSPKRYTPEHTLILDLTKSEEEILAQMKPKGRYNVQVAKRHSVRVREFPNFLNVPSKDFDAFYEILRHTGERDAFGIHPKFFYEKLLETFGGHRMSSLFLAYDKRDQIIAGTIIIFYGKTATYYYGASDHSHRNLMAPYLLQWEAIREAKKRGMEFYDFLGIAPPNSKNHPLAGVTGFKKKFGGMEVDFPPAFDIVYRPWLYRFLA